MQPSRAGAWQRLGNMDVQEEGKENRFSRTLPSMKAFISTIYGLDLFFIQIRYWFIIVAGLDIYGLTARSQPKCHNVRLSYSLSCLVKASFLRKSL